MYDAYIMRRTQIYLTDEEGRLLESRRRATGHTISQLIRAAIDRTYSQRKGLSRSAKVRIARATCGAWKGFPETGAEYVERVRGSRRLARLHGRD